MEIIDGVEVYGTPDPGALLQAKNCLRDFEKVAMMADNHKGYNVPIGAVLFSSENMSPAAVGFDIGCGTALFWTKLPVASIDIPAKMEQIYKLISFGVGRNNDGEPINDELFSYEHNWNYPSIKKYKDLAYKQFGTVGGGNHFVDLLEDSLGSLWIGCHFGSRGFGHHVATDFIKAAGGNPNGNPDEPPVIIKIASDLGSEYKLAHNMAMNYAMSSRDWVIQKIAHDVFGVSTEIEQIYNTPHNYMVITHFDGKSGCIIRKGAISLDFSDGSFVGGSMTTKSALVIGRPMAWNTQAGWRSAMHGAGRVMSRSKAKGKYNRKTGEQLSEGLISKEQVHEDISKAGVYVLGGDVDESRFCYRNLKDVIKHHKQDVKVMHWLTPIGVAMAPSGMNDPYKD